MNAYKITRVAGQSSPPTSECANASFSKNAALERALKGHRVEKRHSFFGGGALEVVVVQDHILESTCSHQREEEEDGKAQNNKNDCQVCRFEKLLGLPHLPEMVFPRNSLAIFNKTKQKEVLLIEFNAFDALRRVDREHLPDVKVGPSAAWQSSRRELPFIGDSSLSFDWTYTSDYQGTAGTGVRIEEGKEGEGIDYERLRRRDPIQFYEEITLYEDELADNGCAQMTVRIRVMPDTFLVLCRFYLRIDNVMVRVCDTRVYGTADKAYALRESSRREANYRELNKEAISALLDPNRISDQLPLIHSHTSRIYYD